MFCYICSALNSLCQYDQTHQGLSRCPWENMFSPVFGCYTVKRPDGLVERGCWRNNFTCPTEDSQCITCNTTGCNNATHTWGQCLECSGSTENDLCGDNMHDLALDDLSKPCPVTIDRPLCYMAFTRNNTVIERGCTASNHYGRWMDSVCSLGIMNCTYCNGNNCNYWILDPFMGQELRETFLTA